MAVESKWGGKGWVLLEVVVARKRRKARALHNLAELLSGFGILVRRLSAIFFPSGESRVNFRTDVY